jgi:hypothetical protein
VASARDVGLGIHDSRWRLVWDTYDDGRSQISQELA